MLSYLKKLLKSDVPQAERLSLETRHHFLEYLTVCRNAVRSQEESERRDDRVLELCRLVVKGQERQASAQAPRE